MINWFFSSSEVQPVSMGSTLGNIGLYLLASILGRIDFCIKHNPYSTLSNSHSSSFVCIECYEVHTFHFSMRSLDSRKYKLHTFRRLHSNRWLGHIHRSSKTHVLQSIQGISDFPNPKACNLNLSVFKFRLRHSLRCSACSPYSMSCKLHQDCRLRNSRSLVRRPRKYRTQTL